MRLLGTIMLAPTQSRSFLAIIALAVGIGFTLTACSGIEQRFARAQQMVAQMRLQDAVDRYQRDHGAAPSSLADLVPAYLDELPEAFEESTLLDYDEEDGEVALGGQQTIAYVPGTIPPMIEQDYVNLDRIEEALYSFHAMYREYPRTLGDLAPRFIDDVPGIAVSGEPYLYFGDTGEVYHPEELAAIKDEEWTEPEPALVETPEAVEPATAEEPDRPLAEDLEALGQPSPTDVLEAGEGLVRQYEKMMDDLEL